MVMRDGYRPLPEPAATMSHDVNTTKALRFMTTERLYVYDTILEQKEQIMGRTPASSLASPTPMGCRRPVLLTRFWSQSNRKGCDHDSAASSALASRRSAVSKPSVNQP
jgi:hypothetical protein